MLIKKLLRLVPVLLIFTISYAQADSRFPSDLNFSQAIDKSLALAQKSGYSEISVVTSSGSASGEVVQKNKDVLILKTKTGRTNLKTGKEKVLLTFVNISTIESISVYILE